MPRKWRFTGITKDESYLISLQAPSLHDMLELWVQLPYDSPLFVRAINRQTVSG
jgi:hypothetical protein